MSVYFFLGVDPGLSGALALLGPTGSLQIEDMPTLQLKKGPKQKRYLDYQAIARLVDSWASPDLPGTVVAAIEQVGAMPGQGVSSTFDFGRTYGALKMALHSQFIRVLDPTPTQWKRAVGIPTGAGKDQSRAVASNLFPRFAHLFARKKDDGRAEAALLAEYARKAVAA